MSGWDAYVNALRGDGSVINGAAIYGQGDNLPYGPLPLVVSLSLRRLLLLVKVSLIRQHLILNHLEDSLSEERNI